MPASWSIRSAVPQRTGEAATVAVAVAVVLEGEIEGLVAEGVEFLISIWVG
jgi:hypothetical protein